MAEHLQFNRLDAASRKFLAKLGASEPLPDQPAVVALGVYLLDSLSAKLFQPRQAYLMEIKLGLLLPQSKERAHRVLFSPEQASQLADELENLSPEKASEAALSSLASALLPSMSD